MKKSKIFFGYPSSLSSLNQYFFFEKKKVRLAILIDAKQFCFSLDTLWLIFFHTTISQHAVFFHCFVYYNIMIIELNWIEMKKIILMIIQSVYGWPRASKSSTSNQSFGFFFLLSIMIDLKWKHTQKRTKFLCSNSEWMNVAIKKH